MTGVDRWIALTLVAACASLLSDTSTAQEERPQIVVTRLVADPSAKDSPPIALKNPPPAYPRVAMKRGEEAQLKLQVTVGIDGKPRHVNILESSGKEYFDHAAIDAVEKQWKFEPAKKDGDAVEESLVLPFSFVIKKPGKQKPPAAPVERKSRDLSWKQLASLEGTQGFAGQFVGVSNGRLLLYGGTNFPDKPIWDGGAKRWYRDVYVLDTPEAKWRKVGALDERRPSGYGVSLTTHHGIVCIGGADADKHYDDAFILNYDGEKLTTRDLPKLPLRCAYLAGASSGGHVYVAGGIEKPDSTEALHKFWTLDLRDPKHWVELPAWEGPGLLLPTLSVRSGNVVLTGGCALSRGDDGKPVRAPYSKATWLYRADRGWNRQHDAPTGLVASPSPPIRTGGRMILFGGDDGSQLGTPPEKHLGFPREVYSFDVARNEWRRAGNTPFAPVTTPVVPWRGGFVVVSGEIRPSVRSIETWFVRVEEK
jgi:N-acetylneuraminate epimerase